jgi:hypothetical protein
LYCSIANILGSEIGFSKIEASPILYILFFLIVFSSCKENPTNNEKPSQPITGRRNYVWTVDTLYFQNGGQTLMQDIWGSSPTNVYAVGHEASGGGAPMWHYNGISWKPVGLVPFYGGIIDGPFSLSAIYGFDSTHIYAVGERAYQTFSDKPPYFLDSSFIIQFDGTTWKEANIIRKRRLSTIHGSSPQNIWCGGTDYSLYHYNGEEWIPDSVSILFPPSFYAIVNGIHVSNNEVYLLVCGLRITDGVMRYSILENASDRFTVIDSFTIGEGQWQYRWGPNKFWESPSGRLYSCGGEGVYMLNGKQWENKLKTAKRIERIFGTGDNNIFAVGDAGAIYHYNGIDWKIMEISSIKNLLHAGVWCTEDEVFITGNDGEKTYIFHGK